MRWRPTEAASLQNNEFNDISAIKTNEGQEDGATTASVHEPDMSAALIRGLEHLQSEQDSDCLEFVNLFGYLQRQLSALLSVAAFSIQAHVNSDRFTHVSSVIHLIT